MLWIVTGRLAPMAWRRSPANFASSMGSRDSDASTVFMKIQLRSMSWAMNVPSTSLSITQ